MPRKKALAIPEPEVVKPRINLFGILEKAEESFDKDEENNKVILELYKEDLKLHRQILAELKKINKKIH